MTTVDSGASDTVIANIKKLKRVRRLTNIDLVHRMQHVGYDTTVPSVTFLLSGRRSRVSVDELVALAGAVGLQLEDLLEPLCPVCEATPPIGFICGRCYTAGDGVEGNPTLNHLREVAAA